MSLIALMPLISLIPLIALILFPSSTKFLT